MHYVAFYSFAFISSLGQRLELKSATLKFPTKYVISRKLTFLALNLENESSRDLTYSNVSINGYLISHTIYDFYDFY